MDLGPDKKFKKKKKRNAVERCITRTFSSLRLSHCEVCYGYKHGMTRWRENLLGPITSRINVPVHIWTRLVMGIQNTWYSHSCLFGQGPAKVLPFVRKGTGLCVLFFVIHHVSGINIDYVLLLVNQHVMSINHV